eukprot:gene10997-3703_t
MLKNRTIPKIAKQIFKNNAPNNLLIQQLKKVPLKYELQKDFVVKMELNEKPKLPTGFEFPIGLKEELPFHVQRTQSGSLPVYIDYKKGRSLALTVVRKIQGDTTELRKELMKITNKIVIEKTGTLEIKGNHVRLVLLYLRGLGF